MTRTIAIPESELRRLKERLALLESIILDGKPYVPGEAEWDRAIEALIHGDKKPMELHIKRGGYIPRVVTAEGVGSTST